jgi:hypothetical protein
MKWGLQGQTRVQRQGDLKDNFIIPPLKLILKKVKGKNQYT